MRLFASYTFCCLVVIEKDFVGKAVLWHFRLQTLLTSVFFFFSDVRLGLSLKGRIYHPLILSGFRIKRGESPEGLTQLFVEIVQAIIWIM